MVYSIVAIPQNNGSPLLNLLSPPWGHRERKRQLVPGSEIVGSAKQRRRKHENKTRGKWGEEELLFSCHAPLSFPRSRAGIFACFSLTHQRFYLSLRSRRLEVMDTRKNGACLTRAPHSFLRPLLPSACYYCLKVMLHETIRNDNFQRDTALQCCNYSKQRRNNVVMLCCAKNRRYESFRVTSP